MNRTFSTILFTYLVTSGCMMVIFGGLTSNALTTAAVSTNQHPLAEIIIAGVHLLIRIILAIA